MLRRSVSKRPHDQSMGLPTHFWASHLSAAVTRLAEAEKAMAMAVEKRMVMLCCGGGYEECRSKSSRCRVD
jgi:hypothetical protein